MSYHSDRKAAKVPGDPNNYRPWVLPKHQHGGKGYSNPSDGTSISTTHLLMCWADLVSPNCSSFFFFFFSNLEMNPSLTGFLGRRSPQSLF